eukprot:scaffold19010_cov115-Isochrysis_galbana.AAC.4
MHPDPKTAAQGGERVAALHAHQDGRPKLDRHARIVHERVAPPAQPIPGLQHQHLVPVLILQPRGRRDASEAAAHHEHLGGAPACLERARPRLVPVTAHVLAPARHRLLHLAHPWLLLLLLALLALARPGRWRPLGAAGLAVVVVGRVGGRRLGRRHHVRIARHPQSHHRCNCCATLGGRSQISARSWIRS